MSLIASSSFVLTPFPSDKLEQYPADTVYTDNRGEPIRLILGAGDLDCRPLYRARTNDWIAQAIVAAEDHRFWRHHGVDFVACARAAIQNLKARRCVSGASTISTQVIRLIEPRPRTLRTKCIEAVRSIQLERRETKTAILGQYLNRAPFGANIVGIEAAARRYFNKAPRDLSLAEAALLAGIPQSPARLRPDRSPDRARRRQAYVLDRMLECGMITPAERDRARDQKIVLASAAYPFRAPHFSDLAVREIDGDLPAVVRTTLDPGIQRMAENLLARRKTEWYAEGIRGGAIVVQEVRGGAVRALVGSPDFFDDAAAGQVNGALAPRSAGSTLKPFLYALALDRGQVTPAQMIPDIPTEYRDYAPENFDETCRGVVSMRDALILSLNLPAIETERRIGQAAVFRALRELGLGAADRPAGEYGLGLAIGNMDVRLLDLVNAYACIARGGEFLPYRLDDAARMPEPRRVLSPESAWLISDILSGSERAFDATAHAADVPLPRFAWKTGTSSGLRDAWTVAWNPDYVIGVWAGNPRGESAAALVGKEVAAPVAWEVARRLYPDNRGPWFEKPAGVKRRDVCADSGCPPGPYCNRIESDFYIAGASSFRPCTIHPDPPDAVATLCEVWPPDIAAFFDRQNHAEAGCASPVEVRITSPVKECVFRLHPSLPLDVQKLSFSARAPAGQSLHWFVDGRHVAVTPSGSPMLWPLERGRHHVICALASGPSDAVNVLVE